MYVLKHGIKKNPEKRWALPDRIFFGYGACHILAGAFLQRPPLEGFYAERIIPNEGFSGAHMYATNGVIAFDYHGYSGRERLLEHHRKGWTSHSRGWDCAIERVVFDPLNTAELNQRKMRGPINICMILFLGHATSLNVETMRKTRRRRSKRRWLDRRSQENLRS